MPGFLRDSVWLPLHKLSLTLYDVLFFFLIQSFFFFFKKKRKEKKKLIIIKGLALSPGGVHI